MAVEARQMKNNNLFIPQLIANRDLIKTQPNMTTACNNQMDFGVPLAAAAPDRYFSYDPISSMNNKSDSGLTYNVPTAPPRKRSRDSFAQESDVFAPAAQKQRFSGCFGGSVIDQDVITQMQQQQSEIDLFIVEHTEKMRLELEDRRRQQTRMLTSALTAAVAKKLTEKDDELQRVGKLNWVLQERVKSLYVENQLWRDLAQSNEAAANNLRTNLEQVLAQTAAASVPPNAAVPEDAASSCGSCGGKEVGEEVESGKCNGQVAVGTHGRCRRCGEREASVLLLPCRHLCLCTVCGSALLPACPVCNAVMNASVHVNMS